MKEQRDRILGYLTGELSDADARALESRSSRDPRLRREMNRLRAVGAMVSDSAAGSFQPFFTSRVLARIELARSGQPFYESLRWAFTRLAFACLAAYVWLGLHNNAALGQAGFEASTVEAYLGWPAPTLEAVVVFGSGQMP